MKIERISENQIRCTLTSVDLSSRNINLMELAYGTEKARRLFREMIQQASNEVGFEVDDLPLMVEAIPLSGESIMLVITKIEDPEELDTRFAKFSPFTEETPESAFEALAGTLLEGIRNNSYKSANTSAPQNNTSAAAPSSPSSADDAPAVKGRRIFRFDGLDILSEAAKAVGSFYNGDDTLYKKPGTRQYYLVLNQNECSELDFSRTCNILAEYGTRLSNEQTGEAYFKEHYETIIANHVLKNLKNL